MKYRLKEDWVEAFQIPKEGLSEIAKELGWPPVRKGHGPIPGKPWLFSPPGYWVLTSEDGNHAVMSPQYFEEEYEPVPEALL